MANKSKNVKKKKGLAWKIAQIAGALGRLQKDRFNNYHGYRYLSMEKLLSRLSPLCVEYGVAIFPRAELVGEDKIERTNKQGNLVLDISSNVSVTYKVVDVETGEHEEIVGIGKGVDASDKSMAKALTGAHKTALMQMFGVSTGDEAEADTAADGRGDMSQKAEKGLGISSKGKSSQRHQSGRSSARGAKGSGKTTQRSKGGRGELTEKDINWGPGGRGR
jgi:hypothetical protein